MGSARASSELFDQSDARRHARQAQGRQRPRVAARRRQGAARAGSWTELDISESRRLRGLGPQAARRRCSRHSRSSRPRRLSLAGTSCSSSPGRRGSGKGTIVRSSCCERDPALWLVGVGDDPRPRGRARSTASTTTSSTRDEFEALRDAGGFLEWFEVYGDLKGTPRAAGRATPRRRATTCCWRSTSRARWRSGSSSPTPLLVFVQAAVPRGAAAPARRRGARTTPSRSSAGSPQAEAEEALADQLRRRRGERRRRCSRRRGRCYPERSPRGRLTQPSRHVRA